MKKHMPHNNFFQEGNTITSKKSLTNLGKVWWSLTLPIIGAFFCIGLLESFGYSLNMSYVNLMLGYFSSFMVVVVWNMVKDSQIFTNEYIESIQTSLEYNKAFEAREKRIDKTIMSLECISLIFVVLSYFILEHSNLLLNLLIVVILSHFIYKDYKKIYKK